MNFPDILDDLGIEYGDSGNKHCTSGRINFDCPFCSPGTGYWRMGYHLTKNFVHCWICGFHSMPSTLKELKGCSHRTAIKILEDLDLDFFVSKEMRKSDLVLPKYVKPMTGVHKKYLEGRGLDVTKAERLWGVQGIEFSSEPGMSWRVFIPIHLNGRIVSWTSRSINDENRDRRYRSASQEQEEINHKELLYGEDLVFGNTILILEGPIDVWKIGPGAVGSFGLGFTRQQVLKMTKYQRRVICFDNEPHAQEVAKDLMRQLEVFDGETYNVQLDSHDPGSANKREVRRLRKFLE